jgi:hypothetical protein
MSSSYSKYIGALIFLGACSKTAHDSHSLFYGECQVTITAQPEEAEIVLDGIPLGHIKAKADIPCGEKQILIEKEGYRPFYQYLTVSKEAPINLKVSLEKIEKTEDYALSHELVEQVRTGKRLANPFKAAEGKEPLKEEEEKEGPLAMDLGVGNGPEGGASGTAGVLPPGDINSVDYWR